MSMRILNFILILVLAASSPLWASSGATGADFLNLGVGPRAIAMGDAQVGLADDVYSTYWNPAGLGGLQTPEAAFVHTEYVQNITEQYLAYAHPTQRYGTFGVSFTYLNFGTLPGYDALAQPIAGVSAHDLDLGLSYSRDLYKDERYGTELSAGVTAKVIQEELDTVSAKAYAGDLGLLFSPGIKYGEFLNGWKAGVALRNLGSSMTFDQESFSLPRTLTTGVSYTGHWRDESITVTADGRQPNDGSRSVGVGLEISTLQMILLRAGYTTEGDLGNGLRFGVGLRFKTIQVDYALASEGPFGFAHRFGLTLRFSPPKPNPVYLSQRSFDRGMIDFKKARYSEAIIDFSKALEIDPDHQQAIEMMKKTYEKLKEVAPE